MKCEKPKQPANDQNSCDNSQHDFFSLPIRARLSTLRSHARRPFPSTVEFLADLICASQEEMSVHLGTLRVHFTDNAFEPSRSSERCVGTKGGCLTAEISLGHQKIPMPDLGKLMLGELQRCSYCKKATREPVSIGEC
jgi:hypothetical protein